MGSGPFFPDFSADFVDDDNRMLSMAKPPARLDTRPRPAEPDGALHQLVLEVGAFRVPGDLTHGRLAHIDVRQLRPMLDRRFGCISIKGDHAVSPLSGTGVCGCGGSAGPIAGRSGYGDRGPVEARFEG